jgi:hypothetical protein
MEMGLLEGVEPRLDEKDMVVGGCVVVSLVDVVDRWSISKLKRLQVPVKLRIENLKVVVVRDAGRRHLIELEAVRQSCVLHSADYAVWKEVYSWYDSFGWDR